MSIQGCQLVPSSDRSHKAVIDRRSSATVSVDRTCAVGASASFAAGGNLRASSKVEDAAVVDRDVHQFGIAFVVEAPCEEAASPMRLAYDLDRSDRLPANSHVDVMH
jgi:hypothetical protein